MNNKMNNTLLLINASAQTGNSRSRKMTKHIVAYLTETNTKEIINRELNQGIPLLDEIWVGATFTPIENRNNEQIEKLKFSTYLVSELQQADTIVIGTPIYNFSIPAVLKAWIDMVARVGLTFSYTDIGPVGLLKNKKVIIAMASGGTKIGSEIDFASNYLRHIFSFFGIKDVTIVDTNAFDLEDDKAMIQTQLNEILL